MVKMLLSELQFQVEHWFPAMQLYVNTFHPSCMKLQVAIFIFLLTYPAIHVQCPVTIEPGVIIATHGW